MTKADVPLAAFALLLAVGCDEPSHVKMSVLYP